MIYCTPWEDEACAKVCESNRTPFPVRPDPWLQIKDLCNDDIFPEGGLPVATGR